MKESSAPPTRIDFQSLAGRDALTLLCRSLPLLPLLLTAAGYAGCAGSETEEPATEAGNLVGGIPIESTELDAVGALVFVAHGLEMGPVPPLPDKYIPFCTGTLIDESTVITAQHCSERLTKHALLEQSYAGFDVAFAIGSDAKAPKKVVPIVSAAIEQQVSGGVLGLGSDVAILHLAGAIKDVTPITFAPFPYDQTDKRFSIMGFGVQNQVFAYGTRHVASTSVAATKGKIYELMYGDFETFKANVVKDWPAFFDRQLTLRDPNSPEANASFRRSFEETTLIDGYEALIGLKSGDGSTCFGDSGGPLLFKAVDGLHVVGVTSWGGSSQYGVCNREDVSAIIGPATADFVRGELAKKTHPCDKIAFEGECDGDTVVRCTNFTDLGERKLSRIDCALLGDAFKCVKKEGKGEAAPFPPLPLPVGAQPAGAPSSYGAVCEVPRASGGADAGPDGE